MRADVVWPAVWVACFVVGVIYGTLVESPSLLPLRTNLRGGTAAGSNDDSVSAVHACMQGYRTEFKFHMNIQIQYAAKSAPDEDAHTSTGCCAHHSRPSEQ